ncbi:UNVERIFIED_CONTAM: hypothetical protein FKN15_056488 [Acipenser sinensis]
MAGELDNLTSLYFSLGLQQREILELLSIGHGLTVRLRTLQATLQKKRLYRRKHYSDIVDVAIYIVEETEISGQLLGYRLMHLKCIQRGFVVKRETDELNTVAHIWNTHPIRAQRNRTTPHGRPLIMYTLPHLYGVADHLCPSSRDDILNCEEECLTRRNYPCDKTVFELCSLLMVERGLDPPGDIDQATHLYRTSKEEIWNFL